MYVCICNAVTDSEIEAAYDQGHQTLDQITEALGVGNCCGRCVDTAKDVLSQCGGVQHFVPDASVSLPAA